MGFSPSQLEGLLYLAQGKITRRHGNASANFHTFVTVVLARLRHFFKKFSKVCLPVDMSPGLNHVKIPLNLALCALQASFLRISCQWFRH